MVIFTFYSSLHIFFLDPAIRFCVAFVYFPLGACPASAIFEFEMPPFLIVPQAGSPDRKSLINFTRPLFLPPPSSLLEILKLSPVWRAVLRG